MRRIVLVNMPFSNLGVPSIALTQLKAVADAKLAGQVSVEVVYLNHDFAKYTGLELYDYLCNSMESLNTGLGDWVFRQVLSPDLRDNTEKYMARYFPAKTLETVKLKNSVLKFRAGLDAFMDELIDRYDLLGAEIAGFTSMFMQNAASFAMMRKLKQRNPAIITIIGGANCEFPMGAVIADKIEGVDFVFSGPALKSFPQFLCHWLDGNSSACHSIRGVFAKGRLRPNSGPETIGEDSSIDALVGLDYEPFLLRFEEYFSDVNVKPVLPIETSRGCWWGERAHCTFCGLNGVSMNYRAMKPALAIQTFDSLFRHSGRVARLTAVDNILPKNYLHEVLPFLNTPEDMEIFYEVKADLSEQDIATLARARVNQIQPGIEALVTSTLKLMKKGTTAFQNITLLKLCALYQIVPHWNLLLGFPGEGQESYKTYVEVIPLLTHLPPPSGAFPVRFDRFSPYFYQADSYKLDLQPLDFYSLIYPLEAADVKNLAYYFADHNVAADYFTIMAKWIGKVKAKVVEWQARWKNHDQIPPRLYFEDDRAVFDSRSGVPVEHSISGRERALLNHLTKPARIETIVELFGPAAADEIESLQQMGLLFQENGRFLNLVLESEHGSLSPVLANTLSNAVEQEQLVQIR